MTQTWKDLLQDKIAPDWAQEIDDFETQIHLNKQGKMEPRIFAETRLRRGAYGQRYDNGRRNDGKQVRKLQFPTEGIWKGPDTYWDAPGMLRIKFPWGGLTSDQMEVMADLSEEYSDGISHITTRQDIQLHFIHIEDTPDIMRRLAAVGITTREACGNSVRNVTACPLAGVCRTEAFDVTPYSKAFFKFMLGHPDAQDFGRKFKAAFSGCAHEACGLVNMHDMGFIAKKVVVNGKETQVFDVYVGGGLGPVPYDAKLLSENCPVDQILPLSQAVARVYGRLGEKKIRGAARIKFLVAKLGIEEFRRLVYEEMKVLAYDPRWTSLIEQYVKEVEKPIQKANALKASSFPKGFLDFKKTNVYQQPQYGYVVVYVKVPLGDLTAKQLRVLAQMSRKYVKDTVRTTVDQNLVFRWVSESDLPALYEELTVIGLGEAGANTISDIASCPGTDTCKLGISASRGLSREISNKLDSMQLPEETRGLKIKVSGCPNSCSQHPTADLGFYGVSRKSGSYAVPHFQLVLGGRSKNNAANYGLAVVAVPSKRVPEAIKRLTEKFAKEKQANEDFRDFIQRVGKVEIKNLLQDLTVIPSHDADPGMFSDWGDPREYTIGDIGKGECAGEVVAPSEFSLTAAESKVFDAQLKLDQGDPKGAVELAYESLTFSAEAVLRSRNREYTGNAETTALEFKKWFFDTGEFVKYVNPQFAAYFFKAQENRLPKPNADEAHRRVEETQLFLEAAHTYLNNAVPAPAVIPGK